VDDPQSALTFLPFLCILIHTPQVEFELDGSIRDAEATRLLGEDAGLAEQRARWEKVKIGMYEWITVISMNPRWSG
jgi:hypothetical protein